MSIADPEVTAEDVASYERDGYVILADALPGEALEGVRRELAPYLDEAKLLGRNDFEGFRTNRVYALLAKAPTIAGLVEHPRVVAMLDQLLLPNFLLSANLAINLWPGETAQPWHFDDAFYSVARPRAPISVSAIWAIDDFTADNGATQVLPGSHLWGDDVSPEQLHDERAVPVEMSPGSVVIFAGTLWHRGGANRTSRPRLAITPQYCQPWARQQENQMLAVGGAASSYSDRIQAMLGYSIHPPFMGHVNGVHPLRLLRDDYDPRATGAGAVATDLYRLLATGGTAAADSQWRAGRTVDTADHAL